MKIILFACIHNAGRSQMAAAFFNFFCNPQMARAISAGTKPSHHVHPEVVQVMKEVGIDLSQTQPQLLTEDIAKTASLLVTMGCGEACPFIPGLKREDWPLTDPKGQSIESVRQIRDEIKARVHTLLEKDFSS